MAISWIGGPPFEDRDRIYNPPPVSEVKIKEFWAFRRTFCKDINKTTFFRKIWEVSFLQFGVYAIGYNSYDHYDRRHVYFKNGGHAFKFYMKLMRECI